MKGKAIEIGYQYVKIDLEQFAIIETNCNIQQEVNFNNEIEFGYDKEQNIFKCSDELTVYQNNTLLLKICLSSSFRIRPDDLPSLINDGKYVFSPNILSQFASLNYGTLRGVLYEKLKGTPLKFIIIPPTYMNKFIKSPFEVNVE